MSLVMNRFWSVVLVLLMMLAFGFIGMACDKPVQSLDVQDQVTRQERLHQKLGDQVGQVYDIFAPGPLIAELVAVNPERSPARTVDAVVERITTLRKEKKLPLASSQRPGGARTAHELARILLTPSEALETDLPTTDLELVVLAVSVLKVHGIRSHAAIISKSTRTTQLEHVVLAVELDSNSTPKMFELTDAQTDLSSDFKTLSDIQVIGLYHARFAGLLFLLNKTPEATSNLEVAMALASDLATPYYVRALMNEHKENMQEQVLEDLQRVTQQKDAPDIWAWMGRTLRKLKRYDEARAMLVRVPSDSSSYQIAQFELARLSCEEDNADGFFRLISFVRSLDASFWEAHRDAALVGMINGRTSVVEKAIQAGLRVAPSLEVWNLLIKAKDLEPEQWPEPLKIRLSMLGACARPL